MCAKSKTVQVVVAGFCLLVGGCQGGGQPSSSGFDQKLIGTWTGSDSATDSEGKSFPIRFIAAFAGDHTYSINVLPPNGEPTTFTGTWQLRNDPAITARNAARILVLTGERGIAGDHLTVFMGNKMNSRLLAKEGEEWKHWQRTGTQ
jgi:hypothetical protein